MVRVFGFGVSASSTFSACSISARTAASAVLDAFCHATAPTCSCTSCAFSRCSSALTSSSGGKRSACSGKRCGVPAPISFAVTLGGVGGSSSDSGVEGSPLGPTLPPPPQPPGVVTAAGVAPAA
eukprot:7389298-Prymnesium_polylepis.1